MAHKNPSGHLDLMTLDANNQPAKLIENYDSLIWTERFNTVGDFQLKTGGDIKWFLDNIPYGTLLTLRESNIAMIAETYQIDRKKNTPESLTITGRSFESILDRRVSIESVSSLTGSNNWTVNVKTPSDLAHYIIVKICVEGLIDVDDIFPGSMVQFITPPDYLTSTGPVKPFDVPRGNLLATVLGLLQTEAPFDISTTPDTPAIIQHGIRAVRPSGSGTAMAIEIYTGEDKRDTIYFDATRDLLDDGTYLLSKVGEANVAYGVGPGMSANMFEGEIEPTGLSRKVILVDASQSGITDSSILQYNMSQSLSEAHETAMFDGSINQDLSPYIYGDEYHLGDIVRVVGDYGLTNNSRVTEYIRSEDATGVKAYPTLTTIRAPEEELPAPPLTYSQEVLADTPLVYYRLGEPSGGIMSDSSGNGRDGSYSGSLTLAQPSLLVDDTNTSVDFSGGRGDSPASAAWMNVDFFTIEALIRPDTVTGDHTILCRDNIGQPTEIAWRLRTSGNKLQGMFRTAASTTLRVVTHQTTLVIGNVYHVAATYDGENLRVFVNGVEDVTGLAVTGVTFKPTQPVRVGRLGTTAEPFDGRIDEATFYGSALGSGRILAHYNASI